jgi:hypothetical protein
MNPVHLTQPPHREAVSIQHGRGAEENIPYFPEGNVAAPPFMVVSPLTVDERPNIPINAATAEWITPRSSRDQGVGVPPFKAWPRQFHSEAYSFDGMYILPQEDQIGPVQIPADPRAWQQLALVAAGQRQRPEVAGWSAPTYGEQYEQPVAQYSLGSGIAQIQDPATVALAIGWGYVG